MSEQEDTKTGAANESAPVPSWKAEFELRKDLLQRDVYLFETALHELGGLQAGLSVRAVHALKAAIDAGWLAAPASEVLKTLSGEKRYTLGGEDVDNLHAGKIIWYGARVVEAFTDAITVPPN